jgi:hypothetical protein
MKPDWLAELAPEHAPSAPGWWPPAPGWWILASLTLVILVAAWLRWRDPRRRLRRRALKELGAIRAGAATGGADALQTAQALQNLLRRYALALFGREAVAGLSGPAWLGFLAARGGDAFAGAVGQSLLKAAYGAGGANDAGDAGEAHAGWFREAEKFLRRAVPPTRATSSKRATRAHASAGRPSPRERTP